jgi:hypothetical protein
MSSRSIRWAGVLTAFATAGTPAPAADPPTPGVKSESFDPIGGQVVRVYVDDLKYMAGRADL